MMIATSKSKERVKAGEVFTPATTVFEMILQPWIRDVISDLDKTVLDPACGQGQFSCTELFFKMFFNLDKLDDSNALRALYSLKAIDIRKDNVAECKKHLLETFDQAYYYLLGKPTSDELFYLAYCIVDNIVIQGDSLMMQEWAAEESGQQKLF